MSWIPCFHQKPSRPPPAPDPKIILLKKAEIYKTARKITAIAAILSGPTALIMSGIGISLLITAPPVGIVLLIATMGLIFLGFLTGVLAAGYDLAYNETLRKVNKLPY